MTDVETDRGRPDESAPEVNVVRVRENGPLAFDADLTIGEEHTLHATLCRCGASKNKPYCDDSHVASGFAASGEPAAATSEPLAARDGPVHVKPLPNGPLRVEGNLEVVSDSGHTLLRTTKTFLCRCGHSSNKPFCDGTHKKIGFEAP